MSPVTSSRIATSCLIGLVVPEMRRSTVAVLCTIDLSRSAALPERYSCQKRSRLLMITIVTRIMMPVHSASPGGARYTSVTPLTQARNSSTSTKGFLNASSNWISACGGLSCATSLKPCRLRRSLTCDSVRPERDPPTFLSVRSSELLASLSMRAEIFSPLPSALLINPFCRDSVLMLS